jgi:hypothetical protein
MPGAKNATFRGVQKALIASVTADTSAALTYGTASEVAIADLSITQDAQTYELKHNDLLQELDQQTQSYTISGTIARLNLDQLAIFTGGSVTAGGTSGGSAEIQTYDHSYDDVPGYFGLELMSNRPKALDGTLQGAHVVFQKCLAMKTDIEIGEDFAKLKFEFKAIRSTKTGKLKQIVYKESDSLAGFTTVTST